MLNGIPFTLVEIVAIWTGIFAIQSAPLSFILIGLYLWCCFAWQHRQR